MPRARHRRNRRPRRVALKAATALLAVGATFTTMRAFAADGPPGGWNPPDPNNPPAADLVSHCQDANANGQCSFQFAAANYWTSVGPQVQVGRTAYNCGTTNAAMAVAWAHTEGQSDSLGISIAQELELFETVKTTVTATYDHTWDFSDTTTETDTLTVPPDSIGWISLAPSLQNVQGDLVMHFDPYYANHGWWKVFNYVQTGPDPASAGNVYFNTRTMTPGERATCANPASTEVVGGDPAQLLVDRPAAAGGHVHSGPLRTKRTHGAPRGGTTSASSGA